MKKLVITDNPTIRKKVYNYVREQILNGHIGPHERLIETKIAREIGTSRTPVREALHNLEIEGLIESIPRVGYAVMPLSDKEAVEIWEIRFLIEGLAVRWAMAKAPQKLIRELKKNIAAAEEQAAKNDLAGFAELDGQFHEIIAKLSGGKRLLEMSQTLRRHGLRYRLESIYVPDVAIRALKGHKAILKAVERGNHDQVTEAIRRHLEQSKKDTLQYAFHNEQQKKNGG
jgi:DNA-binding GntR family transcriptional regulator